MIAGLSSSVFGAIRTAGEARARMDDATRQIATGKRVASVKDDGAAWTRANQMRADASASRQVSSDIDFIRSAVAVGREALQAQLPMIQIMRERALAAADPSISTVTRAELAARQLADNAARQTALAHSSHAGVMALRRADGTGAWLVHSAVAGSSELAWVNDISGAVTVSSLDVTSLMPNPGTLDTLTNAQSAAIQTATAVDRISRRSNEVAAIERAMEARSSWLIAQADRLDLQIGRLTDADMGRASTARAQAETRQALAMQTVRMALDAYSAKATGLLANVQRTQRSVLA